MMLSDLPTENRSDREADRRRVKNGVLYFVLVVALWTTYVAFIYPRFWKENSAWAVLVNELSRISLFVGPAVYFARDWRPSIATAFRMTQRVRAGLLWGLAIGISWCATVVIGAVLIEGKSVRLDAIPVSFWLTAFSSATILEELSFRSFLLQSLEPLGKLRATLFTTVAFVSIHFPGWWLRNVHPNWHGWLIGCVSIGLLGLLLAVVFLRVRSVWATVLIHAFHNLAAVMCVAP